MKWTIIAKKKQPCTGEVLAIASSDECLVGWLKKQPSGRWECESDEELLQNVVAYIPVSELITAFREQSK